MKKFLTIALLALAACMTMTSCVTKVDPAAEGIKVKLVGTDRGVDDVTLVSGWVWYNPFTEEIYEYPNYVQTVDYEEFVLNSKDGSQFTVDPTILIQLEKGEGPVVFRKYRKQLNDVLLSTIYTYVKDAYRIELNKYTADELISNRNKFESDVQAHLDTVLATEHFRLSQVTSGLKYPSSLVEAINMKNKVVQDKQRADNEVMLAKAQAEKLLVSARAEAEANRLRTTALTPAVLEQMWIEKWDGKLPVYGQVPTMFKDISK